MLTRLRRRLLDPRDEGFTLIELVVAMFVIAIVILSLLALQTSALVSTSEAGRREQATAYGNEAIEQLRAIPWNVLKRGMASNYMAAAGAYGGDADVASGVLSVEGTTHPLIVADALNDQDTTSPWPPLFDSTGSHITDHADTAGNGTVYRVKAYVTEDSAGTDDAVGLVVVVDWGKDIMDPDERTVLYSAAYAPSGGCGDLNNAPFLAACQAVYSAGATSGNVVMSASATTADALDRSPILPGNDYYTLEVGNASATARSSSQQVSTVEAFMRYGGVRRDDDDDATQPDAEGWVDGYGGFETEASDDLSSTDAPPANPSDVTTTSSSTVRTESSALGFLKLTGASDWPRAGTLEASVSDSCATGVTGVSLSAGLPCAASHLGAASSASGYMSLSAGGDAITISRIRHDSGSSKADAWSGRFSGAIAGSAGTGCTPLTGSGCISAGATRSLGDIVLGAVDGGDWSGAASSGLVIVESYSDEVRVERGTNQAAAAAVLERSGSIQYWDGSGYSTISDIDEDFSGSVSIPEVTFANSLFEVTARGSVTVTPATTTIAGAADATCKTEACEVNATNGVVIVAIDYLITPLVGATDPYILSTSTTINGSQGTASYKEAANA
ncbi:type IV pilus modification PilV family protein [Demequina mangrovi]|uniref:Prepilin-type N-terminal cleavage/methylation domain-containing protein n=1 Tax=Demequina mangrovi TaxID=1043493 RepID=A0A1H6U7C4_9MICO|nr:prepilin-type N-terminal cleavage/methylation domain-containing protein [Demequina mangrovi]SEI86484.1 prepilin-type N-terminal cleavage/methylation domain-containing protein [Demequina mangrovi]